MKCQIELNLNIKYSKEGLAQGHRPNISQVLKPVFSIHAKIFKSRISLSLIVFLLNLRVLIRKYLELVSDKLYIMRIKKELLYKRF